MFDIGRIAVLAALALGLPKWGECAAGDAEEQARLYRSRQEQREVGTKRPLAPGLKASGLAEIDWSGRRLSGGGLAEDPWRRHSAAGIQLNLEAQPTSWASGRLILDYDKDRGKLALEEAIFALGAKPWEIELGNQFLPFGEFYSRFISGPILDFAETRAGSLKLTVAASDTLDVALALFRGHVDQGDAEARAWDWVAAIEARAWRDTTLGLSALSDLAESEQRVLETGRSMRSVPALSAYVSRLGERFDWSIEWVAATRAFLELERRVDRPRAWNLELAYIHKPGRELALRFEGSRELDGQPHRQLGVAVTWRVWRRTSLSLEYLRGEILGVPVDEDSERTDRHLSRVGVLLSIAF